ARRITRGVAAQISVCWTGATYLLTWYDGTGIWALPVMRDGTPAAEPRLVAANGFNSALAWNGTRALIAYDNTASQHSAAVLLDAQGNVVRSDVPIPDSNERRHVAAVGSRFYVFQWTRQPASTLPPFQSDSVGVFRIAGDGTPLDSALQVICSPGAMAYS